MALKQNEPPIHVRLDDREREVLRLTMEDYIASAAPVSSKGLSEKYFPHLSSATIRAVFSNLEEHGYLHRPHASSGRVPTEKGFRYFVECLLKTIRPTREEADQVETLSLSNDSLDHSLQAASRLLSHLTSQVGIITAPRLDDLIISQVQFIRLSNDRLMAIFVEKNGLIEERIIDWKNAPSQDELWKMSHFLNDILGDLPFSQVREKLEIELQAEKNKCDPVLFQALHLRKRLIQEETTPIYIEGQHALLHQPEFSNAQRMQHVLEAMQQKELLLRILKDANTHPSGHTRIILGEDLEQKEFQGLAFVTQSYGPEHAPVGTVAIAGPTRMNYAKVVPLLEFTAQKMSVIFQPKEP